MHFDQDYIRQLVIEEIAGTISEPDAAQLRQIIAESAEAWVLYTRLHQELDTFEVRAAQEALAYNLTAEKILIDIRNKKRRRRGISIGSIAIVFLLGVACYINFLSDSFQSPPFHQQQFVELRLRNGKRVALSAEKQQIVLEGITLNSTQQTLSYSSTGMAPAGLATLSVPVGKDYKIQLSDGTEVWLNASTRLQFPFNFDEKVREITIDTGEAYVKVAANPHKPFIVHLPYNSRVEILGTAFNVNTYDQGRISVSLLHGAVKMQTQQETRILQPGQQTIYIPGKELQISTFEAENVLAWQQGIYRFEDTPLEEICQVIPRWFGIKVVIDNHQAAERRFTGSFNKHQSLQTSLERLKSTGLIDYYFDKDSILHIQ